MKNWIVAVVMLALCGGMAGQAQDFSRVTQRFHNRARITMDPTVSIQDEDGRWSLPANQLGKLALLQGAAVSNDFWIVATITVTNGTSQGQTLTVNGDTRTWSGNVTTATTMATNSTANGASTNLLNAATTNGFTGLALAKSGAAGITLATATNGVLSVSCSTGWATVALATNRSSTVTAAFSQAFSSAPVVFGLGGTNDGVYLMSVTTTNAVWGSAVTNGYFRWLAFGNP